MNEKSPFIQRHDVPVPAVATAADGSTPVVKAPFASIVSEVLFIPADDIVGADTNTRKVSLINAGVDGTGTNVVATVQFNNGVDADAMVATEITLSTTESDLAIADGDVLAWSSEAVGTGMADPGGLVEIKVARS